MVILLSFLTLLSSLSIGMRALQEYQGGIVLWFSQEQDLSLSTIVLNSRDWSEIIWLPEISRLKSTLQ